MTETTTKWTKGPWRATATYPIEIVTVLVDDERRGALVVAEVQPQGPETRANAELLAAAPDLYEALYGLTETAFAGREIKLTDLAPAIAALARARGEKP